MNWYFDSSVLVAAAVAQHPHHARAVCILDELELGGHRGQISAHGLTEVYSVLTRTPFKPPLYPAEALQIIERRIQSALDLIALDSAEYLEVVRDAARLGWTGGRIHYAVHLRCARKGNADFIYTFNLRDFRTIAPDDLRSCIAAP